MLVDLLAQDAVSLQVLHSRYGPLLDLVQELLGVVPNCDPYLEIWPPAFRTYNVMVPNLLNLPLLGWGLGAPRSTVGLAMYVASRAASRAAGCAYCSAHACSFALRRGATSRRSTRSGCCSRGHDGLPQQGDGRARGAARGPGGGRGQHGDRPLGLDGRAALQNDRARR